MSLRAKKRTGLIHELDYFQVLNVEDIRARNPLDIVLEQELYEIVQAEIHRLDDSICQEVYSALLRGDKIYSQSLHNPKFDKVCHATIAHKIGKVRQTVREALSTYHQT